MSDETTPSIPSITPTVPETEPSTEPSGLPELPDPNDRPAPTTEPPTTEPQAAEPPTESTNPTLENRLNETIRHATKALGHHQEMLDMLASEVRRLAEQADEHERLITRLRAGLLG